jgi:hypothetical protein
MSRALNGQAIELTDPEADVVTELLIWSDLSSPP